MPKVTILPHPTLCPEGKELANVKVGKSLCDLLLENDIEIELTATADAAPVMFKELVAIATSTAAGQPVTGESPAATLEVKKP